MHSPAALAARVRALAEERANGEKTWIAVAGPPGSGKTTMCAQIAEALNKDGVPTAVLPMDGFHFYRKELDMMPDPQVGCHGCLPRGPCLLGATASWRLTNRART